MTMKCLSCANFNPVYRECEAGFDIESADEDCEGYIEAEEEDKVNILKRMYVPIKKAVGG